MSSAASHSDSSKIAEAAVMQVHYCTNCTLQWLLSPEHLASWEQRQLDDDERHA
jgi:hypothetical protein